ncbi:MAG: gluconolaconase, partial [Acidobacteria bacterium]
MAGRGLLVASAALILVAASAAAILWWLLRLPSPPVDPVYLWPVTVSTLAGGPARGAADGPPLASRFSDPFGIAIDPEGVTYVSDAGDNNSIRRVDQAGIVSLLAGGGDAGFIDGPPASARFRTPSGLAFDPLGRRLIVADTGNHAVRAVSLNGEVTTLAGNGTPAAEDGIGRGARFDGPLGVAVLADGSIVVADTYNDRIRRIGTDGEVSTIAGGSATGYRDGPSENALFDTPSGVAVSPEGDVLVADTGNNLVRRIDGAGNVTTVEDVAPAGAGGGWGGLYRPVGIACDDAGHLFVTDANRVVLVGRRLGAITLAGAEAGFANGVGPLARFRGPSGVALDPGGTVRVADSENHRVRQLTPAAMAGPARDVDITPVSWLNRQGGAHSRLKWPVDPQEGLHEVTATLGEARGSMEGDGRERLHTGVDVRASVGAVVRAVRDDEARRPLAATSYEGLNESLRLAEAAYVHVRVGRRGKDAVLDPGRFSMARGPSG